VAEVWNGSGTEKSAGPTKKGGVSRFRLRPERERGSPLIYKNIISTHHSLEGVRLSRVLPAAAIFGRFSASAQARNSPARRIRLESARLGGHTVSVVLRLSKQETQVNIKTQSR